MKQFVAMVCILVPTVALAQSRSGSESYRADLFAGYSFMSVDTNGATSRQNYNGWQAAGALNLNRWLGVEADLSGYYKGLGNVAGVNVDTHDYLIAGGPRFTFKPIFLHALFGVDDFTASTATNGATVSASDNAFATVLGGGIDWKIAGHWSIRPSFDYVLTRHGTPAATQNDIRFGVGLAYAFGH